MRRMLKLAVRAIIFVVAAYYAICAAGLLYVRYLPPLLTAVQLQHWVEYAMSGHPRRLRYDFVPLGRIAPDLQRAVIAGEDARFYRHHGFDWVEIRDAVEKGMEDGRLRGASTITQQLVKNLFLSAQRSALRKVAEVPLTALAEIVLSKRRILELYVNVAEWGPGVYGAEAAARYHYGVPAARLTREQAARLAACLPGPRTRRPQEMDRSSGRILRRMKQMGW